MSHFPDASRNPYGSEWEHPAVQRRTSPQALTALVLTLIGIIPCCGIVTVPIGILLGAVAFVRINADPLLKGRGIALASIVIGVVMIAAYVGGGTWVYRQVWAPVKDGPDRALRAGFAGDFDGFRDWFQGPGGAAPDPEVQAFLDELKGRYGDFISVELDDTGAAPTRPQPGQQEMVLPYRMRFSNQEVAADIAIIVLDPATGALVMRLGEIRVVDAARGDVVYPTPQNP